jgi:phosphate:Na+ symporter
MGSLAGLGLLFVGIKMVTRSLSAMAADRLRHGIERVSRKPALAILFGALTGFVTQSGRTTALIMASFAEAGLIKTGRALLVVLWSNFGCTLVIFAAIFPIRLFVLFLLAVAGASVAFERPKSFVNASSAIFGLAVMLFGLQMMSAAAASLTGFPWFSAALHVMKLSFVFAFLVGLALTVLVQSHLAVVLIAISLCAKGMFDFEQTLMVIYGAQAGAGVITLLTGLRFRGRPRQVIMAQVLYNLCGVVLFLAVFTIGHAATGGEDPMGWFTRKVARFPGAQAAAAALIFNTVTPLVLSLALPAFRALCAHLAPPSGDEDLALPQFLRGEIDDNVLAILVLAEQEQLRLLRRLPAYCAALREQPNGQTSEAAPLPSPKVQHEAFSSVSAHIARFHRALMSRPMSHEDTEWLLNQQKRQEVLNAMEDACHELWTACEGTRQEALSLRQNVVEALDLLLITTIEAMANGDRDELHLLDVMTNNHGATMERVRKKHLSLSEDLQADERDRVLLITSIFERAAWSLRRFGALLSDSPGLGASKLATASASDHQAGALSEGPRLVPSATV